MDFRKLFMDSFDHLKKNPRLVWPLLAMFLVPVLLGFVYLQATGLYGLTRTLAQELRNYEQLSPEEQLAFAQKGNFTPTPSEDNFLLQAAQKKEIHDQGLLVYLSERNLLPGEDIPAFLKTLLTPKNILLLLLTVALAILLSNYFYCSSLQLVSDSLHNKKSSPFFAARFTTYLRFWWLLILTSFFILLLPLVGLGIVAVLALLLKSVPYIWVLWPLAVIAAVLTVIYLLLRLYFSTYIFFYDRVSAWTALKRSYTLTFHNLLFPFLLGLLSLAIVIVLSLLISSPFDGFFTLFSASTFSHYLFALLLVCISLFVTIFVYTFISLFNFQAYLFLKKDGRRT